MQKRYPFKFLDAYTHQDKDIFFGRNQEIDELYDMVFKSKLMLIYGASGTGKTSLIQCGLANKFKEYDWRSLYIRRGKNINFALDQVLCEASEGMFVFAESPKIENLAEKIEAVYLASFCPIYLIFDQFEELYILGSKEEQEFFVGAIQEIVELEQPIKILFSIREEYLGYLYDFEKAVPELLRKKLRIEPMNLDKVQSVLKGINALKNSQIRLEKGKESEITEQIFDKIRTEKSLTIQLPYLQVFLDKLYLSISQDENRESDVVFTLTELEKIGDIGDILRDFLEDQAFQIARQLDEETETIWKILSPFATLDGTKEPLNEGSLALKLPDIDKSLLKNAIKIFTDRRILRFTEHNQMYEVAHDSLAKQIASKRTDEEIAVLEVERLIRTQTEAKQEAKEFFTEKQLNFIEPYMDKLVLDDHEMAWLAESKEHLKNSKEIERLNHEKELNEAKERAEKEALLRGEAEREKEHAQKAERRSRRNLRIVRIIAVLALFISGLAVWQKIKADEATELAKKSEELAKIQAKKAFEAEKFAIEAQKTAEDHAIQLQKAEAHRLVQVAKNLMEDEGYEYALPNLKKAYQLDSLAEIQSLIQTCKKHLKQRKQ